MENIVRKGENACNKQFLLFSQCFLLYMVVIFHFKCTFKCRLQFVSIWTRPKFFPSGIGLILVCLQSTGDSLDDDEEEEKVLSEAKRNTPYNEVIDADNPQTPSEVTLPFSR